MSRPIPGDADTASRDQQEVISLAYYGRLSHPAIAAQLGLSVDTVRDRIRLGMQQLKSRLAKSVARTGTNADSHSAATVFVAPGPGYVSEEANRPKE